MNANQAQIWAIVINHQINHVQWRKKTMMTEKEYRQYPAVNYSSLAAFYNDGINSPDHALMDFGYKGYFEYGKQFEIMLQDACQGGGSFGDHYFITELTGKMPDELPKWIEEGTIGDQYEYTKTGKLNMQKKVKHAYLDACKDNPGKIPVSFADAELLEHHVMNMLKMDVQGVRVESMLKNAEWQVPVIWTENGIEKKALIDCLVKPKSKVYLFDIKTTANFKQFGYMLTQKYWIQEIHYTEGVNAEVGACDGMIFLVASKEKPYLCQSWWIDYGPIENKMVVYETYDNLVADYKKWEDGGRHPRGYLPMTKRSFFIKG
jgi:hypothetical protein